jgi:phosphate-selective porin OprO/OprP
VWGELSTDNNLIGTIRVGQFRQPFSMDALTSVRQLTFLERSLPFNAFVPFRRIGAMSYNNSDDLMTTWSYSLARAQADQFGADLSNQQGIMFSTRITHLLRYDEPADGRFLIHTGVNYDYSAPGKTYPYAFRTQPGILMNMNPNGSVANNTTVATGASAYNLPFQGPATTAYYGTPFFANTGPLALNEFHLYGLEFATVYGPWHTQSEIMAVTMNQTSGGWCTLPGAYCETGYFLTGEHRAYQRTAGVFDRTRPFENFFVLKRGHGGWGRGAWQLAGRVDWVDLDSSILRTAANANVLSPINPGMAVFHPVVTTGAPGSGSGGALTDLTFGVNWYLNPYTKFQYNYVHAMLQNPTAGFSTMDTNAVRLQVDF